MVSPLRSSVLFLLPLCTVVALWAGCTCGSTSVAAGTPCSDTSECGDLTCQGGTCQPAEGAPDAEAADAAEATDGGEDASVTACLEFGAPCQVSNASACCSGTCTGSDGGTPTCGAATTCAAAGSPCSKATECCTLVCQNGSCAANACAQIGATCAGGAECCSGTCTSGKCAQIAGGTCKNLGEACTVDAMGVTDCCSKNCQQGKCVRASSCSAAGDICYQAQDCCNGACQLPDGGSGPGVCATALTGAGGGNCIVGGEPCDSSANCCSHLCVDLGTGKATCVLASGCRETGEICGKKEDCCGSKASGVLCNLASTTPPVGRCSNPTGNQPVGNCCGLNGANCRQDCLDGKKAVCKTDVSGADRCFGGGTNKCPTGWNGLDPNCCIPDGSECQFRDQCCNLDPCVQVNGTYVCQKPTCVAAGAKCTPGATGAGGCCNGLSCLGSGEVGGFICRQGVPGTGADAGTAGDGGAGDAGCAANGTTCTAGGSCCSGTCIGGQCAACKSDGTACGGAAECCTGICTGGKCAPPATCVSQGGTCSGTSECCTGMTCVIAAGAANGTCQPGATCGSSGQACSATQGCCSGLRCANTTGATCAATDAVCSCRILIQ